jgi:hypothetical protein
VWPALAQGQQAAHFLRAYPSWEPGRHEATLQDGCLGTLQRRMPKYINLFALQLAGQLHIAQTIAERLTVAEKPRPVRQPNLEVCLLAGNAINNRYQANGLRPASPSRRFTKN